MGHLSYRLVYYRCILLCAFMGVTSYIWGQSPQLDSNNKPIDVDQCAFYATGDDKGPLCYQYFAFSDSSILVLSSWDFSQVVLSGWTGVTVNSSNGVIQLGLSNLNLGGSIAPELGKLSSLTTLNLDGNKLRDSIPSSLGNLSSLIALGLYNNNLSGPIPSSLGNLSSLSFLGLYDNKLSGPIPSPLGNLPVLSFLALSDNNLDDSIPSSLGNLSSLTTLLLYGNKLSGPIPSSLGKLRFLSTLRLDRNKLSESIPSSLGNLSSLSLLNLAINQLSGSIPSELGNLSSLVELRLYDNNLSDLLPLSLGNLSSLNHLELHNNQLSGEIPQEWKSIVYANRFLFIGLNTLTLANNRFLPDDMASFIGGYGTDSNGWTNEKRIDALDLSPQTPSHPSGDTLYFSVVKPYIDGLTYRGLNDTVSYTAQYEFNPSRSSAVVQPGSRLSSPFEDSYSLKTTLTNTGYVSPADALVFTTDVTVVQEIEVDDDSKPANVAQCALYATGNDRGPLCYQYFAFSNRSMLSSWDFSQLVANSWLGITINGSNKVTQINLQNLDLGGSISPELSKLSSLVTLALNGNNLGGSIPSSLGNLPSLNILFLSSNQLSGEIPSSLGNLRSLNALFLGSNQLSGSIPPELGNLSSLAILLLYDNNLDDSIPSSLGNLSSLTQLRLDQNNLSGSIPSFLGKLSSLSLLNIAVNQLSGTIPSSLGKLSSLNDLELHNNYLSGSIPEEWKSIADLRELTLANNRFLPDNMASFIGGYGTDSNGWAAAKRIATLIVSPQTPSHPEGDTLYFSVVKPYIDGLVYSGTVYTGEYEFNPDRSSVVVQPGSRLSNPSEDSYSLKTTLTNTGYASPADSLVFTTDVTVVQVENLKLDVNNKPVDVAQCALYNAGDDRGSLCHQYFAFSVRSGLSSWDFSQAVADSWLGITVNDSNRVTRLGLNNMNLGGSIAPELGNLSALQFLYLYNNQLSDSIPLGLGSLSALTDLRLQENNLIGTIPSSLGDLSSLTIKALNSIVIIS